MAMILPLQLVSIVRSGSKVPSISPYGILILSGKEPFAYLNYCQVLNNELCICKTKCEERYVQYCKL
jgi:hypothetical protein